MVSFRPPFHFYEQFLGSGRAACAFTLPDFVRHEGPLAPRLMAFESRVREQLERFFGFRGILLPSRLKRESDYIKAQLWLTRALLGFLEDQPTRNELKDGKIPTLVRFERPPARSLHERIMQNVPLFGVSAASLISMGVPLPWNMVGGGLATAVREYAEDFRSHREFENHLRREFKKTGRDPEPYLNLYRHLDAIIPHPLGPHDGPLALPHRLQNYKQLKAFHSKLEEVHHFATGYLAGLAVLEDAVGKGRNRRDAVDASVGVMMAHILRSKDLADLTRQGNVVPPLEPKDPFARVQASALVQAAEARVRNARLRSLASKGPRRRKG